MRLLMPDAMGVWVTRAEQEKRIRRIREMQRYIAAHGLPASADMHCAAALTASLTAILSDRRDNSRASRAAGFCCETVDKSLRNLAVEGVACKKGCSYCCKIYVSASAPEIFAAANYARQHTADLAERLKRIRETESTTRGLNSDQRLVVKQPCVFLENNACTIYPARPLSCRLHASLSQLACEKSLTDGVSDIPKPDYSDAQWAVVSLQSALWSVGLRDQSYEFNHAVLVALESEDAEDIWLSGKDVFVEVARDTSAADSEQNLTGMLNALVALSRGEDPLPNP